MNNNLQKKFHITYKKKELPWVEKYRPTKMSEIVYHENIIKMLQKSIETGNLPHLMFYGDSGCGKTSTIKAICMHLFGPKLIKERVLELNASDERGIKVVRTTIKNFAKQAINPIKVEGHPCPPFKVIILDEADAMTVDSQFALRRIIEKYSKNNRFCLLCNYYTRIINPLESRCSKFRFKSLDDKSIQKIVARIAKKEKITYSSQVVSDLIKVSKGDLRKVITTLYKAYQLDGSEIRDKTIHEITNFVPLRRIKSIYQIIAKDTYQNLIKTVNDLILDAYSAQQFLTQMMDFVMKKKGLSDEKKSLIFLMASQIDNRLCENSDEYIQLLAFTTYMHKVIQG